jgi:uridine kinase
MKGIRSKIIDLDDFYKIPPLERAIWREKNGIDSIGYEEYDWGTINNTIDAFLEDFGASIPSVDLLTDHVDELLVSFKDTEVLIINGLYAFFCQHIDFRVFIELTYRETYEAQKYTGKEELNSFRKRILEKEHEVVQKQKKSADTFIDFNAFFNSYHL